MIKSVIMLLFLSTLLTSCAMTSEKEDYTQAIMQQQELSPYEDDLSQAFDK